MFAIYKEEVVRNHALQHSLHVSLADELRASVDPRDEKYWSQKIDAGLVPARKVGVDPEVHTRELNNLMRFIGNSATAGLSLLRQQTGINNLRGKQVRYYGTGTAGDLREVTIAANDMGQDVIVTDCSSSGCARAQAVFDSLRQEKIDAGKPDTDTNIVYQADAEFATREGVFFDRDASFLVAPRMLDILGCKLKPRPRKAKVEKTARQIGRIMRYAWLWLLHPEPENNPGRDWEDPIPYPLGWLLELFREGLGSDVEDVVKRQTVSFHDYVYTACLLRKKRQ